MPLNNIWQGVMLVTLAFYYQVISRYTTYIQLVNLFFLTMFMCLTIIAIPESPKWLVSKGQFAEAKESLASVARINGQNLSKDNFIFEAEDQANGTESSVAS
jgi:hypothetical protein